MVHNVWMLFGVNSLCCELGRSEPRRRAVLMMGALEASDSDYSVLEASSLCCSVQLHCDVKLLSPSESLTSGSQRLGLHLCLTMPAFYILKSQSEREMNSYLSI